MSSVQMTVDGMTCGGCSGRLKRVMEAAEGVASAEIELATKQVVVAFDPALIDRQGLETIVKDAGFTVVPA
ncbi:copper chaperone [Sphingomonas sp. SORGH_AS 950]|uniref:heavy-metal-associated domain-containing protein n=1 Tax=unclassified Sphingomonas TaxID=196159 RepID=UPI0027866456|nr:heavy-metal-associated domain-containing protein [Sphingomonas sp. SORGH_AS_0950]MDQ1155882.1 copper chaperone [Sphingomonas sp. SORGH_AS_0950]